MPFKPPTFRPQGSLTRREQNVIYDRERGNARQRGYGPRWDASSRGFRRAHPLCIGCEAVGRISATEVTDHVVPHKGDMDVFWDSDRWQPSCGWHHDVVKQKLEHMFTQGDVGVDDLWLNSEVAKQLTLRLAP